MTKSSPISLREVDYGSLTSRERRMLASVLLQMPETDEARGRRIAELREERDLSQPQVVEALKEQEGGKVIGLRGYQLWEAGHGISPDNLKALARFHGVSTDWIKRGDTPDVLDMSIPRGGNMDPAMQKQLDAIQRDLALIKAHLGITAPAEVPDRLPPAEQDPQPDEQDAPASQTG